MKELIKFTALLLLVSLAIQSSASYAQNSQNDIAPLDRMLNPDMIEPKKDKSPVTASDYGNAYFKECNNEDHPIFTPNEKETLCACTAANMTELLSVKEFKALRTETEAGRITRQNVLLYAYAPCMPYVVSEYARKDCFVSPLLQDIVVGKRKICQCVGAHLDQMVATSASTLIEDFNQSQPEKIDFLKHYFMSENYEFTLNQTIKQCLYKKSYGRDN